MKYPVTWLVIILAACSGPKSEVEEEVKQDDWIVLFDGTSMDQWHEYNQEGKGFENWSIQEGVLRLNSTYPNTRSLVTMQEFSSFILSVEWKADSLTNSGIFWWVQEDFEYPEAFQTGVEAQVLDNTNYPQRPLIEKSGSVFGLVETNMDAYTGTGKWNRTIVKVDLQSNEGVIDLNGQLTAKFPVKGPKWDSLVANSGFANWEAFGKIPKGKIGLQEYGHSASFRNIKIKRLD